METIENIFFIQAIENITNVYSTSDFEELNVKHRKYSIQFIQN